MNIARILLSDQTVCTATEVDGHWVRCSGDIATGWVASTERVEPVKFLPPVEPRVVFAIGLNYREHAEEMNKPLPDHPVVTMKNPASVIGEGDPIELPTFLPSDSVDYEIELAVIIGRTCKNLTPEEALSVVAGYTIANDVSARDWQKLYSGGQWCKGKGFDTFCPLGPWMVTPDELTDPQDLHMTLTLGGNVMQESSTADMIFSVRDLISFLSSSTTLLAGTVICTGTPPGVGAAQTPQRFLKEGDQVALTIEGIGTLTNPVGRECLE